MAKITTKWDTNLKTTEATRQVETASRKGLVLTVTDIANQAINTSPVLTGHNKRSIQFEVGPGGEVAKEPLTGAIYSTSGYGGYLETGTHNADGSTKMPPRPYIYPALVKFMKDLPKNIKAVLK